MTIGAGGHGTESTPAGMPDVVTEVDDDEAGIPPSTTGTSTDEASESVEAAETVAGKVDPEAPW